MGSDASYHFGSPADSGSPVALRPSLTGDLPFRLMDRICTYSIPLSTGTCHRRADHEHPLRLATISQRSDHATVTQQSRRDLEISVMLQRPWSEWPTPCVDWDNRGLLAKSVRRLFPE